MAYKFAGAFPTPAFIGDHLHVHIGAVELWARLEEDNTTHIDDDDVHNPDQSVTGCTDEQQVKLLENRKLWEMGEWGYVGVVLSANIAGINLRHVASLWGCERNYPDSNNDHLTGTANELIPEALAEVRRITANFMSEIATKGLGIC